jgi:PAS domain S-box-containing protein/putative nucleotidyltransferase with HDIG domain
MVKSDTLSQLVQLRRNLRIIMIAWTLIITSSLIWNLHQQTHTSNIQLKSQVEAIHAINMEYRNWIIHSGGVYVHVTDKTPPSPWLSHIPERDIKTASGKHLTLLNSSYVFRSVQENMAANGAEVKMHIASLKPINPVNKADAWEADALASFAKGAKEKASVDVAPDGKSYFRFMRPMVTDSYCLKCHARYGDKIGDIRGGVSISLPIDNVIAAANHERNALLLGHGLIWGLGLFGLFIGGKRQKQSILAIEESEAQVTLLTNSIAHAIYGIDLDGNCTFANDACIEILGFNNQSDMLGKEMHELMRHSHKDGTICLEEECAILKALHDGKSVHVEHEVFRRKDGTFFPVAYWAYPVTLEGEIKGGVVTFIDITEQLLIKDELKHSQTLLDSIVKNIPVMVFLKDAKDLRFEMFNKAGESLLGFTRQDLIGKNDYDLFPKELADNFTRNDRIVLESHQLLETPEEKIITAGGETRWLHTFKTGLYDEHHQATHLLGASLDITDRKHAEDSLRESERQLAEAQRMAHLGHWEQDIASGKLSCSDEVYRIYEINQHNFPGTQEALLKLVHPEDVSRVKTAYAGSLTNHTPQQVEYRIVTNNGLVKHVLQKYEVVYDNQDNPKILKATIQDVTTLKQAQQTLLEHQKVLEQALEGTIHTVSMAVELRDPYTGGHQRRVADLACKIATRMGLDENRIHGVRLGAMIHDIGKVGVPAEILSKPSKLTSVEMQLIQEHATMGYNILKDINFPWPIAEIAHQHHERLDGSGYPSRLRGEAILLEARIVAVADVVESIASHRPYRPTLGMQAAIDEITHHRGTLYDSNAVDACLEVLNAGFEFT